MQTFVELLIDAESSKTLLKSLCAQPSHVAVQFYFNLSSGPFLLQVIDLYLLLCTGIDLEHADLSCLCPQQVLPSSAN